MKILITGGAGFIASHIADAYIKAGHAVVVIDNLSSGKKEFLNKKLKFYNLDIRIKDAVRQVIKNERPDVINHHAAQISVRTSVENPSLDAQINIEGLLNLLDASMEFRVQKAIFASSGGVVYGDANLIPTPEGYVPLQPLSPYGVSKLSSELYLYFFWKTYKISYIALRYSNVYGPRQNPHGEAGVVAIFSQKLLNGQRPVINGDGRQTRDYIYVEDVVRANIAALESSYVGAVNIATGKETNVVDIFQNLKKITKSNIDPSFGPPKKGEQMKSCLNISLAREKLKWRPKVSLYDGLQKTVDYFKNHEKKK